jgi:hypothetical protein
MSVSKLHQNFDPFLAGRSTRANPNVVATRPLKRTIPALRFSFTIAASSLSSEV